MTTREGLSRLVVAAELHLARCGEKLSAIDRASKDLRSEVQALSRGAADPQARLAFRGAAASGATAWDRWKDDRARELALKGAELAARRDAQLVEARRAFGRLQMIRKMATMTGRR